MMLVTGRQSVITEAFDFYTKIHELSDQGFVSEVQRLLIQDAPQERPSWRNFPIHPLVSFGRARLGVRHAGCLVERLRIRLWVSTASDPRRTPRATLVEKFSSSARACITAGLMLVLRCFASSLTPCSRPTHWPLSWTLRGDFHLPVQRVNPVS
jgi:hypothetical protein